MLRLDETAKELDTTMVIIQEMEIEIVQKVAMRQTVT
jgi:hypothetical protein